jgi:histidinol-phosphate phosphatase family protein
VSRLAVDVVVPTLGRPSLRRLLDRLAEGEGPLPERVLLVDDRRAPASPLLPRGAPGRLLPCTAVVPGPGRGPAAARNAGWRATSAPWVAFLDDDVEPAPDWLARLAEDLADLDPDVGGSQGRITVPLPPGRRPTDRERTVQRLETARWATADMAYRRAALACVGGFDERFPRAYREDADLALRVSAAGHRLVVGRRRVRHPVRPGGRWLSVALQAGNADDVLMRARHGADWRRRAGVPAGRRPGHLAITALAALALAGTATGRRRLARLAAAGWLAGTAELGWARIAPGPRTGDEVVSMLLTSVAIPPAAVAWWIAGLVRWHRLLLATAPWRRRPAAVLLDRDGTLVVDVPDNRDPERIAVMPGARAALDRLRAAGIALAVISNQSGIGRGTVTRAEVEALNRRVEELLGPLGPWLVCPHTARDRCGCRKPAPGLVVRAAAALGIPPARCAVIGDIGADVAAACAAGARGVLVPTPATRPEEIAAAAEVAADLPAAVDLLLGRAA